MGLELVGRAQNRYSQRTWSVKSLVFVKAPKVFLDKKSPLPEKRQTSESDWFTSPASYSVMNVTYGFDASYSTELTSFNDAAMGDARAASLELSGVVPEPN